jgi:hypothetical protein
MYRFFIILTGIILLACNSKRTSAGDKATGADSSMVMVNTVWPKEDENEFLAGCIESLKDKLPEDSAYMHCNCVLKQLKQKFPNMDSAANYLMDTAKAAAIAANCK